MHSKCLWSPTSTIGAFGSLIGLFDLVFDFVVLCWFGQDVEEYKIRDSQARWKAFCYEESKDSCYLGERSMRQHFEGEGP